MREIVMHDMVLIASRRVSDCWHTLAHAYAHDNLELSARRNYARIFDGQAPAIQFLLSRNIQFRLRYIIAFGASTHSGITRFDAPEIITKRNAYSTAIRIYCMADKKVLKGSEAHLFFSLIFLFKRYNFLTLSRESSLLAYF